MTPMTPMNPYEESIRTRVCTVCLDNEGRGPCGNGEAEACPLNAFMPFILEAVESVKPATGQAYREMLRRQIILQSQEGRTAKSLNAVVGAPTLEELLPGIVDAVEDVNRDKRAMT